MNAQEYIAAIRSARREEERDAARQEREDYNYTTGRCQACGRFYRVHVANMRPICYQKACIAKTAGKAS